MNETFKLIAVVDEMTWKSGPPPTATARLSCFRGGSQTTIELPVDFCDIKVGKVYEINISWEELPETSANREKITRFARKPLISCKTGQK